MAESAEFKKLYKYLDHEFGAVNKRIDNVYKELKGDIADLSNSVDRLAKAVETYVQEMIVMGKKVERLEGWIKQIADKTGVKLTYE